jgi:hypothetical protein
MSLLWAGWLGTVQGVSAARAAPAYKSPYPLTPNVCRSHVPAPDGLQWGWIAVLMNGTPLACEGLPLSAIDTQKRLEAAYGHRDVEQLRTLIHDDCVVSSVAIGGGATIRGREAIVAELVARAASDWVFQMTFDAYRELDEDTLLITGAVRRRAGQGGHAMSSVAWLNEFADGVLVSSRSFSCEMVALDAYGVRVG